METLRYAREIRWLFQAALAILVVTVGLGMAGGMGFIDFEAGNAPVTHLHSGVIGWITLGVMAAVLWLFGGTAPRQGTERLVTWTTIVLVASVPFFVIAWWLGSWPGIAVTGSFVVLGIVMYVVWLVRRAAQIGYRGLTTPQLGAVVALITLIVGSGVGLLIAIQETLGSFQLSETIHLVHAETQISAYLVLVAMSLVYWRLLGNNRTRGGTWMVWLFLAAGVIIALSLLANVLEGSIAFIPLDIAAFAIFLALAWRRVVAPGWFKAESARHYAVAIPFALLYLAIFMYLILGVTVLGLWPDPDHIPTNLIPASSHPLFVGMATMTLFGLLYDFDREKRSIWPWADHVVFWGITLSVVAFTVAILFEADDLFKLITPVLGVSILVGVVVHTMRLQAAGRAAPEQAHVAMADATGAAGRG